MVKEGLARCVNWSMGNVTEGADKLRAAEKAAKEKKVKIWKDYSPAANSAAEIKDKSYTGKVCDDFDILMSFSIIIIIIHLMSVFSKQRVGMILSY